ncbi:tRNA(Met) cytidine acetyltransferase TmcA [Archaeoglobus veneficus]|nr:tRNA(Met) cytidine acetyltransferase TmcA [Archaeoglobus veneficus]
MTVKALLAEVQNAASIAIQNRHRFMVMLCCSGLEGRIFKLARKVFRSYKEVAGDRKLLVVGRNKFIEMAKEYFDGKFVHYRESPSILGETHSALLLDLTEGFHPNDLGIIVETIAEGGIIIAIGPHPERWNNLVGKWHEELISEPYTVDDITPRFYRRFIRRTLEAEGIIVFNADKRKFIKRYEYSGEEQSREEIQIPSGEKEIKRKLYKLCATQDQVRVLQLFETFFDREKERKAVVITADRGRGKTAVLGIVTPYLISRMHRVLKRPVRIMVVAPTPQAVQTYFRFLKKALVRQGMKNYKVKESNGLITVINSKFARVEYVVPRRAMIEKDYADIIIVDEAAGIDVPVLWQITEGARYIVFSTTIHGYEGAGRGFSIRFLKRLEMDEDVEIEKIHLEEPIRYGKGDPIEAWLYDVLLLDAQPAELDEDDLEAIKRGRLTFEAIDKDEMFNDEKLLREFFGIYVLAHYRNRPSDVVILADMPNHFPFRVAVNGKTVCSIHIAIEGGIGEELMKKMADGYKPRGQIIPDLVLKHYWDYDFPELMGVRIVRIATHPSVMKMGIGSFGLQRLIDWASGNELDWIGSGFGVSPELLRFWLKNDFSPIHITPQRNEVSGEHTVIVLKALKMHIQSVVEKLNSEFVKRLLEWLNDELADLEVETAIHLLHSLQKDAKVPRPDIGEVDRRRLKKYFHGISLYEYVSDVARPLVRYCYSRTDRPELNEEEERVLIAKCLQLKPWWEIESGGEVRPFKLLLKALQKVWRWYDDGDKL